MNLADNLAFDADEDKQIAVITPNAPPLTPIIRRTSTFFDQYDSVSMFTESTVPSDVNAMWISDYERLRAAESSGSQNSGNNNVQYNIRLDKVVIVGGN